MTNSVAKSLKEFAAQEKHYETLNARTFPVVEVFGPTIQGEGALAGAVTHFIRFGGCDYACSWCDSAPAVLPSLVRQAPRINRAEIMERLRRLKTADWVTISGGNPALHDLELLVNDLHIDGYKVAAETQGSKWRDWLNDVDQLTISPKPPSAKMPDVLRGGEGVAVARFEAFMRSAHVKSHPILKVPIYDRTDFIWATELHRHWSWYPFYLSVVTRMGGLRGDFAGGEVDTIGDILNRYRQVIDWTMDEPTMKDVRVIPQLHALVWGHERGH